MNSRHIRFALAAATIATLAACGGGGGDDGGSPAAVDPIDKHMGTFVANCRTNGSIQQASNGGPLQSQMTASVSTKVSASKALVARTLRTYTSKDCSGTALSTLTLAADGNTYLQVDGTATIGTQSVDKVTVGEGVFFPGITAKIITINGVSYTAPYTGQTPQTYKDINLLQGSALYGGDFSKPLDAQGYPTALAATPGATKQ